VEVLESSDRRGVEKENGAGDVLRIDQDDLETVIPKVLGERVRILNGRHRGKKARVQKLDKADYRAELKLADNDDGEKVVVIDYEDFSAIA
jgi:DNA/RNA-binding protein KIN17